MSVVYRLSTYSYDRPAYIKTLLKNIIFNIIYKQKHEFLLQLMSLNSLCMAHTDVIHFCV